MFWRVASGSVSSSVEAILSRDSFTLEQLLAEDELVKEIKLPNEQLVDFLLREQTLTELMHLLVDAPSNDLEGDEKFNLPNAACEVLCCESPPILDAVVKTPAYLEILFTAPETPKPTDSVMAGFFARAIACLVSQRASDLMAWLRDSQQLFIALADRLENTGIAESIVRLVGADEQTSGSLAPEQLHWISDTAMLSTLLDKLEGGDGAVVAENAAEVLAAIARARTPPLTYILGSPDNICRLLDLCSERERPGSGTQLLVQALTICIALVERQILWHIAHQGGSAGPLAERDHELEGQAVQVLAPKAAHLLRQLSEGEETKPLPPLGSARLTVVALIAVLLRTGLSSAEEAVMDADLLSLCLTLFISYPFNSILHHKVSSILGCALEIGSDMLVQHIFRQCDLLHWLTSAPSEVFVTPHPHDNRKRGALRAGYTGHITQIATKVAEAAETRPLIAEQLELHHEWKAFAAERLLRAHQMEDLNAWECGRPILSERPPGSSDADDHLGLDGDLLNGGLPSFEQNSFGIQSAFRIDSDSDEDSPTRAETLFADAMEYDDDYAHMSKSMNGLDSQWDDEKGQEPLPKAFNQRRRLDVYEDGPGDALERVMNGGGGLGDSGGPQLQQPPHSWGGLLNGHLPTVAEARSEASQPVDSWESLASDDYHGPANRRGSGDENQDPKTTAHSAQTPAESHSREAVPRSSQHHHPGSQSSQGHGDPVDQDGVGAWRVEASSSVPLGESPPGMGHSPLQQALQSPNPAETQEGGPLGKAAAPAIDQAEFRQPCQAGRDPNHESLDDQAGFVLRYIDECATGREVSDRDSHPMGKSNSEDSDDLSQEIGESLTNEETIESEGSKPEALTGHSLEREEETLVGNFTKLDVERGSADNHAASLLPGSCELAQVDAECAEEGEKAAA